jgi:hypothetical protein
VSGSIEFLRDQFAVPGQNGVRLCNAGDLSEQLPAEALTNFGKRGSFRIGEPQTRWEMRPQKPVLGCQVFIPEQKLLIDPTGYVRQQSRPLVHFHSERP